MVRITHNMVFLTILLLCCAADLVDDAVRSGYAAFQRQEYDAAIAWYEGALKSSADPGRLAAELGAVCAQAERYSEAAAWFGRCLEDAQGQRRVKAAYGQATSLTHVGKTVPGRRGVAILQQAMQMYEMTLREWAALSSEEQEAFSHYKADTEHNRSITQQLLTLKLKEPEPPENTEVEAPPVTSDALSEAEAGLNRGARATPLAGQTSSSQGNDSGTSESTAGRGNLPPLPDEEDAPPLGADDAQRRIDALMARLRQPLRSTLPKPGTKDW